jgi:hypothetical protein
MSVTGAAMAGRCAWHDVPDDAVITVPNRAGKTMVWPMWGVLSPDHPLLHAGPDDLRRQI